MTTERRGVRRPPARPGGDRGFTLVELLIVIVVLGILSGIVVFGVGRFRSDATTAACGADVATVTRAAAAYQATTGEWPADLAALLDGDYLKAPPSGSYRFDPAARTVTREPACTDGAAPTGTASAAPVGGIVGIGGKCVDLSDASGADGTSVRLGTCAAGSTTQRWTAPASWPGPITVLGKCLDVNGGRTENRSTVQLYGCNGTGAQVWAPRTGGVLVNPQSGRCLDAENGSSADGTRLIIWDCHGNGNQQWAFS